MWTVWLQGGGDGMVSFGDNTVYLCINVLTLVRSFDPGMTARFFCQTKLNKTEARLPHQST